MKRYFSLIFIGCCLPLVLFLIIGLLPTFDDFTTLQSPHFSTLSNPQTWPTDAMRRPFDFLFGWLLGKNTALFPWLNHVVIITGHTLSTLLVFLLCRHFRFSLTATHIATLFFFFSPATLGATTACDGLNQTYAQLWGLLSLWCFVKGVGYRWLWPLCIILAVLAKENGLAWAVIPPLIGYGFGLVNRKQFLRHEAIGILIATVYMTILLTVFSSQEANVEYPDEYFSATLTDHVKDLIQLMAYTWVPLDYMSVVYAPERCWPLAVATLMLSLPFLVMMGVRVIALIRQASSEEKASQTRTAWTLVIGFFILVSPHLLTLVSIMHNYAALSLAALFIAVIVNRIKKVNVCYAAFSLFLLAAFITDGHHIAGARQSGLLGKEMAADVIRQTPQPVQKVYVVTIDDEETPRYSHFGVRPVDAFAWGLSVRHYVDYAWPQEIADTIINHPQDTSRIVERKLQEGYEAVWTVSNSAISVRNKGE